jgi:YihY family inner membrane protein
MKLSILFYTLPIAAIKLAGISITSAKDFIRFHGLMRASALTYVTLMAFVPMVVLISSLAGHLGYLNLISEFLPYITQALQLDLPIDKILPFVEQAQQENFRSMGLVGSLGLLFSFFLAMGNLEENMNVIWGVPKNRNPFWRLALYTPFLLLIVVFLLVVFVGLHQFRIFLDTLVSLQTSWGELKFIHYGSVILFFVVLTWIFLSLVLMLIPNYRVYYIVALASSSVTTFFIFAYIFAMVHLQSLLFQRTSILYGSIAFFPLFLFIIYGIWVIVLFGNSLSQNLQKNQYFESLPFIPKFLKPRTKKYEIFS